MESLVLNVESTDDEARKKLHGTPYRMNDNRE